MTSFGFIILLLCIEPNIGQYQGLSGHQVWKLEGDVSQLSTKLLVDGMADVLDLSGPRRKISIDPTNFKEVRRILNREGITHTVMVDDLATYLEEKDVIRTRRQTEDCTAASCPNPLSEAYMTIEQIEWYLLYLNATYFPNVEVTSIGKSIEERDIWQVHIKAYTCNYNSSAVWLEGGLHAREWISTAVTLHLINRLVKDCSIGRIFDTYIVPMANPDGYVYSWTTDRLWRKNRRDNPDTGCDGVDLNRNWDFDYGVGASSVYCSPLYKGTSAFSEPETRSLKTAMENVNREKDLIMVISIHSYGQTFLYPYGGRTDTAPFTTEMIERGNIFAEAAAQSFGTTYRILNSLTGYYLASGATDDWSKGVLGVKYVYTLELRDTGSEGFVLSADKIAPSAEEIWEGLRALFLSVNPKHSLL